MIKSPFDSEKNLEVLLYIAEHCPIKDIYHVLKILFFADRKHLERYARFISGENYIAMKNGPVASYSYDFLKIARGEYNRFASQGLIDLINQALSVEDNQIKTKRACNSDYLSQSDIICLNESIKENGSLSFSELNDKSHDKLWQEADHNSEITFESFIAHSGNVHLKDYLNLND